MAAPLWFSCSFQPCVPEWLSFDGFRHMKDFTLMCHTVPAQPAKHQSLSVACSWTNVFICPLIVCLSCKCCKQVLTCQPTRCHMLLCHDPRNSCPPPLCVAVCGSVCENVLTAWVINGCKRSFSPRFCTKPRTNKEKGQRMKGNFMAITDFLKNTASLYLCAFLCEVRMSFKVKLSSYWVIWRVSPVNKNVVIDEPTSQSPPVFSYKSSIKSSHPRSLSLSSLMKQPGM